MIEHGLGSPPAPAVKDPISPDQPTHGPYTFSAREEIYMWDMTLDEAMENFVRYALPPDLGWSAMVLDRDGVVVIGYVSHSFTDKHFWWRGVRPAVEWLRGCTLIGPEMFVDIEMEVLKP